MNRQPRLLAIFAHPDDETLLAGPLLAKCAAEGATVRVVCVAPGDDERQNRFLQAIRALGVHEVATLRYSGSPVWPDGPVPQEGAPFITSVPLSHLVGRIQGRIEEFRPDVVVTHSQYGDYGHPDHAAVHSATVAAFDRSFIAGSRLYALAWPLPLVRVNAKLLRKFGGDTSRTGANGRIDLAEAVRTAPCKSAVIDARQYVSIRRNAARAYSSEIARGPLPLRMLERSPVWGQRLVLGKVALSRIRPAPGEFERELFVSLAPASDSAPAK
ncbi:MAG: PIG-L family deacetylase [Dehalococcoidia bacterium]